MLTQPLNFPVDQNFGVVGLCSSSFSWFWGRLVVLWGVMIRVGSALLWLCPSVFDGVFYICCLCGGLFDLSSGFSTLTLLYGWISALSLSLSLHVSLPRGLAGMREPRIM